MHQQGDVQVSSPLSTELQVFGHISAMGHAFRTVAGLGTVILGLWATGACGGATRGSGASAPNDAGPENLDSSLPAASADGGRPTAADFSDVWVDADFTQPVWLPPPSTTVVGDAASLLGTWAEVGTDGGTCGPPNPLVGDECFQLAFRSDASGVVHGTIRGVAPGTGIYPPPPQGPFAPATDSKVGYPTTVDPTHYFYLKEAPGAMNVDYRLFDPVLGSGTLTFWFSTMDLWSDWCALQTPSEWNVGGQVNYRCAPQTATSSTIDFGTYLLCTSAEDGPQCTDSRGYHGPCRCLDDAGVIASDNNSPWLPLCSRTVCECSAIQCRADVRDTEMNGSLVLSAGELSGMIDGIYHPVTPLTFRRVGP
jgi:hypothetical protein